MLLANAVCVCKTHGKIDQALIARAYSPSYSGGRDQEDCSLKPT
jgi:hypothetical protein